MNDGTEKYSRSCLNCAHLVLTEMFSCSSPAVLNKAKWVCFNSKSYTKRDLHGIENIRYITFDDAGPLCRMVFWVPRFHEMQKPNEKISSLIREIAELNEAQRCGT